MGPRPRDPEFPSQSGVGEGAMSMGKPTGGNRRLGQLLHPFGDDDVISRAYSVVWGFFGYVAMFLVLLSPFSTLFFGWLNSLAGGVAWLHGIVFLWITLWIGWLLVLIQTYNRPTRVPRAFCKTLIPLLILTAFAVALSAIFIHLTYLADCEAPEFGPSHGASVKVNSCPAYGTRCTACSGHGTPYYNASATDYGFISCHCDGNWIPSHGNYSTVISGLEDRRGNTLMTPFVGQYPCMITSLDENYPAFWDEVCTDCNWCTGNGVATLLPTSQSARGETPCACTCNEGFRGPRCNYANASSGGATASVSASAYIVPDAEKRIVDAVLARNNALIIMTLLLSAVAAVGLALFCRLACFHWKCFNVHAFSDQLRQRLRAAAAAAVHAHPGTSLPPPVLPQSDTWVHRLYAKIKNAVGEKGAFTYPTIVLLAGTVTPVILIYSCFYIYSLAEVLVVAGLEEFHGTIEYLQAETAAQRAALVQANAALTAANGICAAVNPPGVCALLTGESGVLSRMVTYLDHVDAFLARSDGWLGNLPTAALNGLIAAEVFAAMYGVFMVWKNITGFKRWTLATFAGKKIPGYNVTTKRSKHTVAPSAAFLAVFVSTHFLGMLGILGLLWAVFTLLGWNELGTLLSERMTAIYSYVIMYVIVKIFLTKIVLNKWLSEKGSAKLPRILSNFTLSLSVYYVFTGITAAVTRIVMFIPLLFVQFCRLDHSFFPDAWQAYDSPFIAFQSVLQSHTRSTNPIAFAFAEQLHTDAAATREGKPDAETGQVLSMNSRRARTRWHLAKTLVRNPALAELRLRGTHPSEADVGSSVHNPTFVGADSSASLA